MPALSELAQNFRPPAFPGSLFLSFEGIEGAGKSTQIRKVQEHLESQRLRVLVLREPGGTVFGEKLRRAILDSKVPLHPVAEMHLFASSRTQLLAEVTLKELEVPGTVIIYDRYLDSSLAYQGRPGGPGMEAVLRCHGDFPLTLVPHMTFYLKIDLATSRKRQRERNVPQDYFESRDDKFYEHLLAGYDKVCQLFPQRICLIDGLLSPEEVALAIREQITKLLQRRST